MAVRPRVARAGLALVAVACSALLPLSGQQAGEGPPLLSPLLVETLAPLLAGSLIAARDAARAEGVEPMPPAMRATLTGYVPSDMLERVRWRVGGSELSIPQNVIRFGHADAMTLDDVIVFADRSAALSDPKLWAHELKHVMQFAEWGIAGFATRYLRDYEAVEFEAEEFRWQFMKQAGLTPPVPPPRD